MYLLVTMVDFFLKLLYSTLSPTPSSRSGGNSSLSTRLLLESARLQKRPLAFLKRKTDIYTMAHTRGRYINRAWNDNETWVTAFFSEGIVLPPTRKTQKTLKSVKLFISAKLAKMSESMMLCHLDLYGCTTECRARMMISWNSTIV